MTSILVGTGESCVEIDTRGSRRFNWFVGKVLICKVPRTAKIQAYRQQCGKFAVPKIIKGPKANCITKASHARTFLVVIRFFQHLSM